MKTLATIKRLETLVSENLYTINGNLDYDRITDAIIQLANAIHTYDGDNDDWCYIGEDAYALTETLIGAYWHYSEWHNGQWSKGYVALSALGQVYSPHMESVDESNEAYIDLNEQAEKHNG